MSEATQISVTIGGQTFVRTLYTDRPDTYSVNGHAVDRELFNRMMQRAIVAEQMLEVEA